MSGQFTTGKLMMTSRGYGFVTPDDKPDAGDLYIAPEHLNGALHGDFVKVQIISRAGFEKNRRGRVIEIIEQSNRRFIATFLSSRGVQYAECDDPKVPYLIRLLNTKKFSPKVGYKILIEVIDDKHRRGAHRLKGKILEVLGNQGDIGVDMKSIMLSYGLEEEFSADAATDAARIEELPSENEIARRIDRRQLSIVTIDGEDAKDLDDGVYAEKFSDGGYFLGVYIADVSWYVREGEPLDTDAQARGTSVYLVDRVIPMLPRELSNGICSLNAGVNRLAMACEMRLNADGVVESHKIFPTVIKVRRRLNYSEVNRFFKNEIEMPELGEMLSTLKEIRDKRFALRTARGAIDFDLPELKVRLDESGKPIEIIKRVRDTAESLIEECMLAANETVAKHLFELKVPSLYRVHEPPPQDNLKKFNELLNAFGHHIKIRAAQDIQPSEFQRVLTAIKGKRGEQLINSAMLRTMQQARYAAENLGHFGLAAEFYTHFTSPIRRYPDLIVHRMLRETFDGRRLNSARRTLLKKTLPEIAMHSSTRERNAADAERESVKLKVVEYMQRFVGQLFVGMISGVTGFGFFVELENGAEGLVRASEIDGGYYKYVESEFALIGEWSGRTFRVGDSLQVKLVEANVRLKQLTFILVSK